MNNLKTTVNHRIQQLQANMQPSSQTLPGHSKPSRLASLGNNLSSSILGLGYQKSHLSSFPSFNHNINPQLIFNISTIKSSFHSFLSSTYRQMNNSKGINNLRPRSHQNSSKQQPEDDIPKRQACPIGNNDQLQPSSVISKKGVHQLIVDLIRAPTTESSLIEKLMKTLHPLSME